MSTNRKSFVGPLAVLLVGLLLPMLYLLGLGPVHFFIALGYLPTNVVSVYEPLERGCAMTTPAHEFYWQYVGWWRMWAFYTKYGDGQFPFW
jgi:hypothetical protein